MPAFSPVEYITGGPIFTGDTVYKDHAIVCEKDTIAALIPQKDVPPDATCVDAGGRLIVPGFVNAHHHAYSALATGLSRGGAGFEAILENLWWALDAALDEDMIRLSAWMTWRACVRHGVTTVFDHHASYGAIRGSLDILAEEAAKAGIRVCVCYEVSDRHGVAARDAAIAENAVSRGTPSSPRMMGMHASFTLSDDTLSAIVRSAMPTQPVHVHCAEDTCDVAQGSPVERFYTHGLLRPHSLLIHGVHLTECDMRMIAEAQAYLVHCPESNMHNGVGMCDIRAAQHAGVTVLAGTDGMHSAMVRSYMSAYCGIRHRYGRGDVGYAETREMYNATQALPTQFFTAASGKISIGTRADIAILEYVPVTPLTTANVWAHMLYGASTDSVYATIAGGACVYHAQKSVPMSVDEIQRAREIAARLHAALHQ